MPPTRTAPTRSGWRRRRPDAPDEWASPTVADRLALGNRDPPSAHGYDVASREVRRPTPAPVDAGPGYPHGHVPQHHDAARPRARRHPRGDRGRRPPVRTQGERGPVHVRPYVRGLRAGGRSHRGGNDRAALRAAAPPAAPAEAAAAPSHRRTVRLISLVDRPDWAEIYV